jgi:hypothetical protein
MFLLCCVCSCEFKYLQDEEIGNTNTIWHHIMFYIDGMYITHGYTDGMFLSIFFRELWDCSLLNALIIIVHYTWVYQHNVYTDIVCLSVFSRELWDCSLLNALIIIVLLIVHFCFPMKSPTKWKVVDNIWRVF